MPLTQGFEDGAPGWVKTGMWHVQSDPQSIAVAPDIADRLVTLPDAGALPAAPEGDSVAWFGEPGTGTYCGSDYLTVKQTPNDGCTSTQVERGTLTSPSFSLAGQTGAYLVFRAWWEIEAVDATDKDLMPVQYSVDGGVSWHAAGALNPLDPSWGGRHQSYSDGGARSSSTWQAYAVDLGAAAGQSDVRVRFGFDTVDSLRNGFRGLLIDGVALVDPLGAVITNPSSPADPGSGTFTDSPPTLSVDGTKLVQKPDGTWSVDFTVNASRPVSHPLTADWSVHGRSGAGAGSGQVTIAPGTTSTSVSAPVTGADAPYSASLANPSGGVIVPGGSTGTTSGGVLPVIALGPVTASPGDPGTVVLSIGVSLSPAASGPVSVDYTATGSDGVVGASGTVTIPAGATSATITVSASSAHAPYTVSLSAPRGALLDPAATSSSTSPLAGTSAVTSPGTQIVLGARITGGDQPTLDQTFLLTSSTGTIRYHTPGGVYLTLASGATIKLPLGSVVDATSGHALITVESDDQHTLQQGDFWEGKFGVFQVGNPAVTELRLAGGNFAACVSGARHRRARGAAGQVVRKLWANAKGSFRTKGRFAAATVRGTKWLTEDLCLATRVTVAEGIVGVTDLRRRHTTALSAPNSLTVTAAQGARYRSRRGVHGPRLSRA